MDHPKTPFFVWSWTSRDIHSYIHTSSYIYSALSQVDDTIPPWFLVDNSSKSSKQWLVTSLKAPDPRKKNSPPNAPPRFLSWQRERSTVLVTCLGKQKKTMGKSTAFQTPSHQVFGGFWMSRIKNPESKWDDAMKKSNKIPPRLSSVLGTCKANSNVRWWYYEFFRGCKLINVFLSQQECKQNCCLHQMLEGWRVDILHNIPNGMTQIWKSWTMKGLFDLRV